MKTLTPTGTQSDMPVNYREEIRTVMRAHPDLCRMGWKSEVEQYEQGGALSFVKERNAMQLPAFERDVRMALCLRLGLWDAKRTENRWLGIRATVRGENVDIPQGALIVAAILDNWALPRKPRNPNCPTLDCRLCWRHL